jgi:mannitol/fructose-specific phosphotransferase system IIA component (Ntr-type)
MNLGQFTEPRLLVPRLLSEWRDSTISVLSQRLESAQRIEDATAFTHAVLDHESRVSAVFDEVAFPLARSQDVKELSFALGLSQQGVRWGTGRTPVVHMVVLSAVPLSEGQRYIGLVLTLSSLLKDEMAFAALRRCTQPEEMWTVLNHVRCVRTGPGAITVQP